MSAGAAAVLGIRKPGPFFDALFGLLGPNDPRPGWREVGISSAALDALGFDEACRVWALDPFGDERYVTVDNAVRSTVLEARLERVLRVCFFAVGHEHVQRDVPHWIAVKLPALLEVFAHLAGRPSRACFIRLGSLYAHVARSRGHSASLLPDPRTLSADDQKLILAAMLAAEDFGEDFWDGARGSWSGLTWLAQLEVIRRVWPERLHVARDRIRRLEAATFPPRIQP